MEKRLLFHRVILSLIMHAGVVQYLYIFLTWMLGNLKIMTILILHVRTYKWRWSQPISNLKYDIDKVSVHAYVSITSRFFFIWIPQKCFSYSKLRNCNMIWLTFIGCWSFRWPLIYSSCRNFKTVTFAWMMCLTKVYKLYCINVIRMLIISKWVHRKYKHRLYLYEWTVGEKSVKSNNLMTLFW